MTSPALSPSSAKHRTSPARPLLATLATAVAASLVAIALVLMPGSSAQAATPTVLGHDISWPQCPAGSGTDVGGGYGKGYGNPMPPTSTGFVVIGLTDGLPFTTNHCLADQVGFAARNRIPVGAYTMTAYPTGAQIVEHGATGPGDGTTSTGQLFNAGYAMARYDLASMAAAGLTVPFVWIDVEGRKVQNWPTGTAGKTANNRAVLQGAARGFADAGLATGWYSYDSGWKTITGSWQDGAPMWQTAGSSVPAGYAGAKAVCSRTSFNSGPIYLGQRVSGSSDLDATCPSLPSFGTLFSLDGVPAPQPGGAPASTTPTASASPSSSPSPSPTPTGTPSLGALTASAAFATPGSPVTFSSKLGTDQKWTATLVNACTQATVRTWAASGTGAYHLRWDGKDATGAAVPTGVYRMDLVSGALSRSASVELTSPGSRELTGCGVLRQYGTDRYATSVAIGATAAPGSPTVVVAAGVNNHLVDGLVAAPLAKLLGAPLLLSESGRLSPVVAADVSARKATVAYLIGGTGSLSDVVVQELRARGVTTIERLSGKDRYLTAAAVARTMQAKGGAASGRAWIASGLSLPDALAAGGVAAAAKEPILLTDPRTLPPATSVALISLKVTSTVVAGGTGAVSTAVTAMLPSPKRLSGPDRYATAAAIAASASDRSGAVLASGADGQLVDALAGGSFGVPVLLAGKSGVPAPTGAWLTINKPAMVRVLGGPTVLGPGAVTGALAALGR